MRAHMHSRNKEAMKKRPKEVCPECGKDVHDPDCAYNEKNR